MIHNEFFLINSKGKIITRLSTVQRFRKVEVYVHHVKGRNVNLHADDWWNARFGSSEFTMHKLLDVCSSLRHDVEDDEFRFVCWLKIPLNVHHHRIHPLLTFYGGTFDTEYGAWSIHQSSSMENSQRCPLLDLKCFFYIQLFQNLRRHVIADGAERSVNLLLVLLSRLDVMKILSDGRTWLMDMFVGLWRAWIKSVKKATKNRFNYLRIICKSRIKTTPDCFTFCSIATALEGSRMVFAESIISKTNGRPRPRQRTSTSSRPLDINVMELSETLKYGAIASTMCSCTLPSDIRFPFSIHGDWLSWRENLL